MESNHYPWFYSTIKLNLYMMPDERLELSRVSTLESKSSAYTDSANPALLIYIILKY